MKTFKEFLAESRIFDRNTGSDKEKYIKNGIFHSHSILALNNGRPKEHSVVTQAEYDKHMKDYHQDRSDYYNKRPYAD